MWRHLVVPIDTARIEDLLNTLLRCVRERGISERWVNGSRVTALRSSQVTRVNSVSCSRRQMVAGLQQLPQTETQAAADNT